MEIVRTGPANSIAAIWLTREDQADDQRMAALPGIIASLVRQKLTPVVYRSGTGSLYDGTLALLRHNRGEIG